MHLLELATETDARPGRRWRPPSRRSGRSPTPRRSTGSRTSANQLEQVERHIAETFANLDERDRTLTEAILQQVQEHGELVARETSRVVEAMQGYVQGGAEAMGDLAQRVEEHAESFAVQDGDLAQAENVGRDRVARGGPAPDRHEQLELMSEGWASHALATRIALDASALERFIDARMRRASPELIRATPKALPRD